MATRRWRLIDFEKWKVRGIRKEKEIKKESRGVIVSIKMSCHIGSSVFLIRAVYQQVKGERLITG